MLREDGSGSWSGVRSSRSIRSFLACSFVFIEVSNWGVARSSFFVLPVDRESNLEICCLVTCFFLGGMRDFIDVAVDRDGVNVPRVSTGGDSSSEEDEMGSSSINGRN